MYVGQNFLHGMRLCGLQAIAVHLTSFAEQDSCCMMKSGPFSDQLELCSQELIIYNGIHTVISYCIQKKYCKDQRNQRK